MTSSMSAEQAEARLREEIDTPIFRLPDQPELLLCVGSEAGALMGHYRGELYKKYPLMWRRPATHAERRYLVDNKIIDIAASPSVTLVKAEEIKNIIDGNGHLYKHFVTSETRNKNIPPRTSFSTTKINLPYDKTPVLTPLAASVSVNCLRTRTKDLLNNFEIPFKNDSNNEISEIVPIKLDIEINNQTLRDVFVLDKSCSQVSIQMLAQLECEDFDLPKNLFEQPIIDSITSQIQTFAENKSFIISSKKAHSTPEELTIIIKLDISIGCTCYIDSFEWKFCLDESEENVKNSAIEDFALKTCAELGLGGEFATSIIFSMRHQISYAKRSYLMKQVRGDVDDTVLSRSTDLAQHDLEISNSNNNFGNISVETNFLQAPSSESELYRNEKNASYFAPKIDILTEEEIERKFKNMERNSRRMRRMMASAY
ncbi:MAG: SWI SNF, matrix associated, actin dependent regulator of chromatin, subfamily b, member 1 [Paramarteilia canceri]